MKINISHFESILIRMINSRIECTRFLSFFFFFSRSYLLAVVTPEKDNWRSNWSSREIDSSSYRYILGFFFFFLNSHRTLPTYARRNRIVAYVVGKRLGFEFSFHACHEVLFVAQKHPFFSFDVLSLSSLTITKKKNVPRGNASVYNAFFVQKGSRDFSIWISLFHR